MATYAEREQARRERALRRADRREEWAARREEKAAAASERSHEIADHIPLGQPVLAGHHSQRRHERDLRRIRSLSDRATEHTGMAQHHARRAGGIRSRQDQRASGPTTERRIAALEADLRRITRDRKGRLDSTPDGTPFMRAPDSTAAATLDAREAEITEQLAYWRAHLAQLTESGAHRVWARADFRVGDGVQVRGRWYRVLRVNAKSLTVPSEFGGWTETVPYDKVSGRRAAEEE
jgi:hypothetical protein